MRTSQKQAGHQAVPRLLYEAFKGQQENGLQEKEILFSPNLRLKTKKVTVFNHRENVVHPSRVLGSWHVEPT